MIEEKLNQLIKKYASFDYQTVYTMSGKYQAYKDYVDTLEDRKVNLGFANIDENLGGFRPSEVITVVSPTNIGKTAFAMNVGLNVCRNTNYLVLMFSLETSEIDLFERYVQMLLGTATYKIEMLVKKMDKEFDKCIEEEIHKLKNIVSIVKRVHINEVIPYVKALEELLENKTALIIIDYVGLIQHGDKNEYQGLTGVMRKLKEIALILKVPILLLSQTDRVNSKEGNLDLYSGKGSGEVENSSQILFTLEKPKEIPPEIYSKLDSDIIRHIGKEKDQAYNLLLLTTHKKKRGYMPDPTIILFEKKTLRMVEYKNPKEKIEPNPLNFYTN